MAAARSGKPTPNVCRKRMSPHAAEAGSIVDATDRPGCSSVATSELRDCNVPVIRCQTDVHGSEARSALHRHGHPFGPRPGVVAPQCCLEYPARDSPPETARPRRPARDGPHGRDMGLRHHDYLPETRHLVPKRPRRRLRRRRRAESAAARRSDRLPLERHQLVRTPPHRAALSGAAETGPTRHPSVRHDHGDRVNVPAPLRPAAKTAIVQHNPSDRRSAPRNHHRGTHRGHHPT